ncbi:class I SAM-dependent methyltransferase [Bradyrhizobium sp. AUGA SZCCT0160]|uniref:class I SAM-dependent methyltransferase n=1 Tax=Bradyrhizobium sp. AUGA SZCCT0160 TaxID=2807662 RepID=UPI001BAE1CC7|nr:class I SAM-dependent methyltransferase [Bradyrhizobium sp. AUGA SZCCT0160]MBR1190578.1 class I SAM-dependent methyltransferase [Bradyrhizobium sp. AUGA SZCCT0160]
MTGNQATIDVSNRKFWDELCGTIAATRLGLRGHDSETLQKYDDWFFGFYYYLDRFIPFSELAGKKVLEIGLGYGSVSQRLAASGTDYSGLDIASGPVHWVNHRLDIAHLPGRAIEGSALDIPFPDDTFDHVVTIGCLHHTGNLQRGINEVRRVLKPGGRATIMVYDATNYIRWIKFPITTFRYALAGSAPLHLSRRGASEYDTNIAGQSAPETVMVSKAVLTKMLAEFSRCDIFRTNMGEHRHFDRIPRRLRVEMLGPWVGLDLYALVTK